MHKIVIVTFPSKKFSILLADITTGANVPRRGEEESSIQDLDINLTIHRQNSTSFYNIFGKTNLTQESC